MHGASKLSYKSHRQEEKHAHRHTIQKACLKRRAAILDKTTRIRIHTRGKKKNKSGLLILSYIIQACMIQCSSHNPTAWSPQFAWLAGWLVKLMCSQGVGITGVGRGGGGEEGDRLQS